MIPAGLAALLLLATLGEGGAAPTAALLVHGGLALLVVIALSSRRHEVAGSVARPPTLPFPVFAALAAIGAARGPYLFAAWLVLLEIAAFAAALWLASRSIPALPRILPIALAIGVGVYAASIIAGLADVDAITYSMSTLAKTTINPTTAATAITLAAMTNMFVKLFIAFALGTREFGKKVSIVFIPMIAAGFLAIIFIKNI